MEVVQLDDPLEAGLQVAILFEHPVILGADGLLDSGDLAAGRPFAGAVVAPTSFSCVPSFDSSLDDGLHDLRV